MIPSPLLDRHSQSHRHRQRHLHSQFGAISLQTCEIETETDTDIAEGASSDVGQCKDSPIHNIRHTLSEGASNLKGSVCLSVCLFLYTGLLLMSYVMWSGALDNPYPLLSESTI